MRLYPDAVNAFLEDPASGLTSEKSRASYRQTLRQFALDHPDLQVGQVRDSHLVDWLAGLGIASSTLQTYKARLKGFFGWAEWKGLVKLDPTRNLDRHLPGRGKPVRKNNWLTDIQVKEILNLADRTTVKGRRDDIMLRLGFSVGLRREEIIGLTWSGIDLGRQQATLVGKGSKLASVFIPDTLALHLAEWQAEYQDPAPQAPVVVPVRFSLAEHNRGTTRTEALWGRRMSEKSIGVICQAYSEASGHLFRPHDMRRSFAGILEDRGVPIEDISSALRHSNLGVTQRYLERRQDAAYQAVRRAGLDF